MVRVGSRWAQTVIHHRAQAPFKMGAACKPLVVVCICIDGVAYPFFLRGLSPGATVLVVVDNSVDTVTVSVVAAAVSGA